MYKSSNIIAQSFGGQGKTLNWAKKLWFENLLDEPTKIWTVIGFCIILCIGIHISYKIELDLQSKIWVLYTKIER